MAAPWSTPVGCRSGHAGPLRVEPTPSGVRPGRSGIRRLGDDKPLLAVCCSSYRLRGPLPYSAVTGPFRSVERSGRCRVGELLNRRGDPAPGVRAVVIAVGRELVGPRGALLERFIAVALQHQGRGTPDIDLGIKAGKSYACG
jgi:hypothetical protein